MTYGKLVAERYKKQYCKRGKWKTYDEWDIQPERVYIILRELRTKKAIEALLNPSWTRQLDRQMRTRMKKLSCEASQVKESGK